MTDEMRFLCSDIFLCITAVLFISEIGAEK